MCRLAGNLQLSCQISYVDKFEVDLQALCNAMWHVCCLVEEVEECVYELNVGTHWKATTQDLACKVLQLGYVASQSTALVCAHRVWVWSNERKRIEILDFKC